MSSQSQVTTLEDAPAAEAKASAAARAIGPKGAPRGAAEKPPFPGASGKKCTITIHPSSEEGGGDAVPVSINGFAYQIPRGEPWQVPVEVVEILKNAKTTHYSTKEGGGSVQREAHRYAMTIEA